MTRIEIAASLIAAGVAMPALAQDSYTGTGSRGRIDCRGGSAKIEGASNDNRVVGACKVLIITGASNRVTVDMAKGGVIHVTGANNEIYWTTPDGSRPRVEVSGVNNRIAKAR